MQSAEGGSGRLQLSGLGCHGAWRLWGFNCRSERDQVPLFLEGQVSRCFRLLTLAPYPEQTRRRGAEYTVTAHRHNAKVRALWRAEVPLRNLRCQGRLRRCMGGSGVREQLRACRC